MPEMSSNRAIYSLEIERIGKRRFQGSNSIRESKTSGSASYATAAGGRGMRQRRLDGVARGMETSKGGGGAVGVLNTTRGGFWGSWEGGSRGDRARRKGKQWRQGGGATWGEKRAPVEGKWGQEGSGKGRRQARGGAGSRWAEIRGGGGGADLRPCWR